MDEINRKYQIIHFSNGYICNNCSISYALVVFALGKDLKKTCHSEIRLSKIIILKLENKKNSKGYHRVTSDAGY